jgi:hypothetical protein
MDLLRPAEVWRLVGEATGIIEWRSAGFMPFFYDRQSNYLGLFAKHPLAFRVAHVPHDGDNRLVYADFNSCILNLLRILDEGGKSDAFFGGIHGDYPPAGGRSIDDQNVAKALLGGLSQVQPRFPAAKCGSGFTYS